MGFLCPCYPLVNCHITMENQWANQLFLWTFSIANCWFTKGYHISQFFLVFPWYFQLGFLFPIQHMESHKNPWFQTTNQYIMLHLSWIRSPKLHLWGDISDNLLDFVQLGTQPRILLALSGNPGPTWGNHSFQRILQRKSHTPTKFQ